MSSEFATVRLPGLLALRSGRSSRPFSPMTPPPPAVVAIKKPAAATYSSVRCACSSSRRDDSCSGDDGRLVDEGMAVLRRRIQEMEAAERGQDKEEEEKDWPMVAWEEDWPMVAWEEEERYATNDADVCHLLLAFLVNSRPGVVRVGLVAVLVLALPAASALFLVQLLLDIARAIISN